MRELWFCIKDVEVIVLATPIRKVAEAWLEANPSGDVYSVKVDTQLWLRDGEITQG